MSNEERLKKSEDPGRASRNAEDRNVTENRAISDDDRLAMFRQSFFQSALPDLPEIPGYHVCWLTTANPRDSIHSRRSLGYTPIMPEEVPGWEHASLKTGEYAGCIGVNEMVAFKLPMKLYEAYMAEAHYERPLKEEGKLADTADFIRSQARQLGGDVYEGDGIAALRSPMSR
jgi:hypothetical protein